MLEIAPQDSRGPCDDGAAIGVELFEDAQVRVARCTFPPGAVHVCHSHPSYLYYVASGGRAHVSRWKGSSQSRTHYRHVRGNSSDPL